jgi:hypothetical protein
MLCWIFTGRCAPETLPHRKCRKLVEGLFFDPQRYDLGAVGRYKLNGRLKLENKVSQRDEGVDAGRPCRNNQAYYQDK